MCTKVAMALIAAAYLHVAGAPEPLLYRYAGMPKLAQYCVPDDVDADRVFCRA